MDNFKIIEKGQKEPSLSEAQDFVGGFVEGLEIPNGDYMLLNEEGLIHNLDRNQKANNYLESVSTKHGYATGLFNIVGPVILIKHSARKQWA